MGAFDGRGVCELVHSYYLYELSKLYEKKDIELYRHNWLAVRKNEGEPESERIKKSIQSIFLENEFKLPSSVT